MKSAPLKSILIFSACIFLLCIGGWIGMSFSGDTDISYQRYFNENYKIFSLSTPRTLTFGEEEVPLHVLDVREKLDKELLINTYWQSQALLFHKRANRWFPVISPILEEEGVPDDFKYLALIESGLENVVSPAGATGFWQFLPQTGREYGLEVNEQVDERYHVEKATRAACKYLKDAFAKYGSWSMAAASYNMGMRGLDLQIERQKTYNYWDLLLNSETSRYMYRILAVKEIISKPSQYGIHYRPQDLYPPYETKWIEVDTSIQEMADFAHQLDINYKILKILNPWLRENYLINRSGKAYQIKVPVDTKQGLIPFLPVSEQNLSGDTLNSDTLN
jgi:hypothetical protein